MARRLLVPTLVALAALAIVPAAGAGFSLGWDLLDCEYVIAVVPVPASRLAPFLPEGFRSAMVGPPAATALLPERVAQVGFEADVCASGAGVAGRVAPMQYASIWTGVVAPPSLNVPGYQPFVNFDTLVPDDERRALMQSVGLPAHDGAIVSTDVIDNGPAHAVDVSWTMDGFGEITMTAVGPRASAPFGGQFFQYTESSTGELALWKTRYASPLAYTYVGTVSFPAESWLAGVFGSTTMPARVLAGHWSYTDGSVAFPVG